MVVVLNSNFQTRNETKIQSEFFSIPAAVCFSNEIPNIFTHKTNQKLIFNDSSIEFNRNLPKSYLKLVLKMLPASKMMNYDKKIQPCSFTSFFLVRFLLSLNKRRKLRAQKKQSFVARHFHEFFS